MNSQEITVLKKKRGPKPRPPAAQVKLCLRADLLDPLDAWVAANADPKMNRQKAISHFIRKGLGLGDPKSRLGRRGEPPKS